MDSYKMDYILRNPSLSGVLTYQELCMAARNEEKRQAESRITEEEDVSACRRDQNHNMQLLWRPKEYYQLAVNSTVNAEYQWWQTML